MTMSRSAEFEAAARQVALPDGIELYELGGQCLFPVYAMSGGLLSASIAFVFKAGNPPTPLVDMGNGKLVDAGNGWKFNSAKTVLDDVDSFKAALLAAAKEIA